MEATHVIIDAVTLGFWDTWGVLIVVAFIMLGLTGLLFTPVGDWFVKAVMDIFGIDR